MAKAKKQPTKKELIVELIDLDTRKGWIQHVRIPAIISELRKNGLTEEDLEKHHLREIIELYE